MLQTHSHACCCRLVDVELFLGSKGSAPYVRNVYNTLNKKLSQAHQPLLSGWYAFPSTGTEGEAVKTKRMFSPPEPGEENLCRVLGLDWHS